MSQMNTKCDKRVRERCSFSQIMTVQNKVFSYIDKIFRFLFIKTW